MDQVGLLEMKSMPQCTGGHMVLGRRFNSLQFRWTLRRVFNHNNNDGSLDMVFNATVQVITQQGINVLNKKSEAVKPFLWRVGGLDSHSSLSLYFDTSNATRNGAINDDFNVV
ncbi:hypothetical protein Pcinc_034149 [Petrolisthes cinctipes]|uniref:Protein transport protein SEC23 n=1 Tax=Petrolisthes cinctipes TaxID=88211 RepID=A0AAE1EQS8_PETCI|nr:hypothetical protein Pcinc_034149 [Petrolisthes cinctipes]